MKLLLLSLTFNLVETDESGTDIKEVESTAGETLDVSLEELVNYKRKTQAKIIANSLDDILAKLLEQAKVKCDTTPAILVDSKNMSLN